MITYPINIHIKSSYSNPNYIQVFLKEKTLEAIHEYKDNQLVLYILKAKYKRHLDYEYLGGTLSKEIEKYGSNFIIDLKDLERRSCLCN